MYRACIGSDTCINNTITKYTYKILHKHNFIFLMIKLKRAIHNSVLGKHVISAFYIEFEEVYYLPFLLLIHKKPIETQGTKNRDKRTNVMHEIIKIKILYLQ